MKGIISILLSCLIMFSAFSLITASALDDNGSSDYSDIIDETAIPETSGAYYSASPDEAEKSETAYEPSEAYTTAPEENTEPSEAAYQDALLKEIVLGELKDGYKLCYLNIPPPPWMNEFSVQYGRYIFTDYNNEGESGHGYYVKKNDEKLMLSEAFERGITDIEEVVSIIKEKTPKEYNYRIFSVVDAEKLVKERYNLDNKLEYIGIMYAGYYLFYENNPERALVEWVLRFEFGDYAFDAYGGHTSNKEPEALGLYVLHEGKILNIKEALEEMPNDTIWTKDLVELINSKDLNYSFKIRHKEIESSETTSPTQPFTGMYIPWLTEPITATIPATTVPEPAEAETKTPRTTCPLDPESAYIKLKSKNTRDYKLDVFKELKDGVYLTHKNAGNVMGCYSSSCIDKYIYWICDDEFAAHIYDYKNNKEYKLTTAYNKGIISKKNLAVISKALDKPSIYGASLYENEEEISAGQKTSPYRFFAEYGAKKVKISNRKVVKLVTDKKGYVFVGLKKGKADVTITQKNGKPVSQKIIVKSSPKLTNKKGRKIKAVTVKAGGTAVVCISGKAKGVNNKYTNTNTAKVVSKKSAEKIKIYGLKKGKTTLKIKVNGVKLKLRVRVVR